MFKLNFTSLTIFILLLSLPTISSAQDTISPKIENNDIQEQLENIAESSQNEEADYTDLLASLYFYAEHPINLNQTTREELQELKLLNDIQINNLLNHIEKNGKLIVIYELQSIDGFD